MQCRCFSPTLKEFPYGAALDRVDGGGACEPLGASKRTRRREMNSILRCWPEFYSDRIAFSSKPVGETS